MTRRNKVSTPRFNINSHPNKKLPQLVYLIYRYKKDKDGKPVMLKYSIGLKIYPRNWDKKMQSAKAGVNFPEPKVREMNTLILQLKTACMSIVSKTPDIPLEDFKKELDVVAGRKIQAKSKSELTLLDYIRHFIQKSNKHERTIAKYQGVYNHIKAYQKESDVQITFEMINEELSEQIANWLYQKEMSQNTVSKILQTLKQIIHDAYENEYHTNKAYQSKKFGVPRVKTSKLFLEIPDLEKLAKHDFSENKRLDRVRDIWLIAANTGLRVSDFSRLNKKEHFEVVDGQEIIRMNTYKGEGLKDDTEVVIPVLPVVMKIIEKYNNEVPKSYSDQKMNNYIKEVCEVAGLNRLVKNTRNVGGKLVRTTVPLYKLITNHSARYTFINIMLNDYEISPITLKKITGQSLKVLMGYERGDKVKAAKKVVAKLSKNQNL